MVVGAGPASVHEQLGDGVLASPGEANHGADRTALAEQVKDARAIAGRELVHKMSLMPERSRCRTLFAKLSDLCDPFASTFDEGKTE